MTLKATITNVHEGSLKFTVNGVNAGTVAVKNSAASMSFKIPASWKPGTYTVKADYLGTTNYNPSSKSIKGLTVKPLTVVKYSPVKGKTNIAPNKVLTIKVTFSENIKKGTTSNFKKIVLKSGSKKISTGTPTIKGKIFNHQTRQTKVPKPNTHKSSNSQHNR